MGRALLLAPVPLLVATSCTTLGLWDAYGPWPPAANRVTVIDDASFAAGELHFRVSHRSPWWRTYRVPCLPSGEWLRVLPSDDAMPPSDVAIYVVSRDELERLVDDQIAATVAPLPPGFWLAVAPSDRGGDALLILDARAEPRLESIELPSCGLAWTSPNLVGHLAATPATLAVDAVTTAPLFAVVVVLMACGVRLGH